MAPKARVQKRLYYKIGEACKALDIQPYVLRYWETEFPALSPNKSRSGQRVYSDKELEIIRRIKELLYDEGYTIAGAKKKLEAELASGTLGVSEEEGGDPETAAPATAGTGGSARPRTGRPAKPAPAVLPELSPEEAGLPFEEAGEVPPAAPEPPRLQLDTQAAERIQSLRKGIEQALHEARGILAYLAAKSPPRSPV
jgi:DNA-binding transcriptional MerR regulator